MTGFGPIFQLQIWGTICPCLEKSENKNARQAVSAINASCRRVQWQPSKQSEGGGAGFIKSWFGNKRNNNENGSNSLSTSTQPCLARILLRDSGGDGQPEIFVDPIQNITTGEQRQSGYKLNIKLRRVDKVSLDGDQIILTAKPPKTNKQQPPKELLRFTALQYNNDDSIDVDIDSNNEPEILPVTQDTRNMLMHHFMVIVEWERQRRADLLTKDPDSYEDSDDDDDENQPNFLQARAQKAKHFATREIELQRTKKEREKRKAELVAQSGGLKYTAIAMSNMQQQK